SRRPRLYMSFQVSACRAWLESIEFTREPRHNTSKIQVIEIPRHIELLAYLGESTRRTTTFAACATLKRVFHVIKIECSCHTLKGLGKHILLASKLFPYL